MKTALSNSSYNVNSPPEWTPHYCDFVHLNSKGRALSHAWLLRMLQDAAR